MNDNKYPKQDRLVAKLRGGGQIAEVIPTKDPRSVLIVFDDGSKYRTTMDEAMAAMTAAETPLPAAA